MVSLRRSILSCVSLRMILRDTPCCSKFPKRMFDQETLVLQNAFPIHTVYRTFLFKSSVFEKFNFDYLDLKSRSNDLGPHSLYLYDKYRAISGTTNSKGDDEVIDEAEIEKIKKEIEEEENFKNLNILRKFHYLWKKYWYVAIPVHCVTSAVWFGTFYSIAVLGFDVTGLIQSFVDVFGFGYWILETLQHSSELYQHAVAALALYKLASPFRYAATIGGTTFMIRVLSKAGYIQPVPSRERLRQLMDNAKGGMKGRYGNFKDRVEDRYDNFRDRFKKR